MTNPTTGTDKLNTADAGNQLDALSDLANTIIALSTCDDLDEPWRGMFNRLGWDISERVGVLTGKRGES